jgi:succinoglycan biosynthesis protein ExoW
VISVVIPYYQREPGVLRRALESVAAQRDCPHRVQVIVVDDESPVAAEGEIAGISWPHGFSGMVVQQPNGGPGAARNRGLDSVAPGTRYVAFLDSDDEWSPRHLARALTALEAGYDFYFADHLQLGADSPAFTRAGRITPHQHPTIPDTEAELHAFRGDMFNQILTANVVGTPTVVYRYERFKEQRFRVELTTAGEDYLFWLELCRSGARTAFSAQTEAICGRGVNVFARSGWGTDGFALRLQSEIRFRRITVQLFALTQEQATLQRHAIKRLREAFVGDVFHRLAHRKPQHWRILLTQLERDPLTLVSICLWLPKRVLAGGKGT